MPVRGVWPRRDDLAAKLGMQECQVGAPCLRFGKALLSLVFRSSAQSCLRYVYPYRLDVESLGVD